MSNLHLSGFLSYRINHMSELVTKIVTQVYEREVNLTLRELRILRTVGSTPGIVHSKIVEQVLFEKSLVSRLISSLVKKSYLKREIDQSDARRISFTLTRKGVAILEKADKLGLAMNNVWLSALTAEEQKAFETSLDKLTSGLTDLAQRFEATIK